MKKTPLLIVLLTILVLANCNQEGKENVIPEDTYIKIIAELHIIRTIEQNYSEEINRDELLLQMFDHYQITEDEFDYSHRFYQRDVENQRIRLRKARDLLQDTYSDLNTLFLQKRTVE